MLWFPLQNTFVMQMKLENVTEKSKVGCVKMQLKEHSHCVVLTLNRKQCANTSFQSHQSCQSCPLSPPPLHPLTATPHTFCFLYKLDGPSCQYPWRGNEKANLVPHRCCYGNWYGSAWTDANKIFSPSTQPNITKVHYAL